MKELTFAVTRFPSGYLAKGQNLPSHGVEEVWDWESLVRERLARKPSVGEKGFVPQLFPGRYIPDAPDKRERSVRDVCLLALDCDGITFDDFGFIVEVLQAEGLAFVATPTYSHDPQADVDTGKHSYRFFLPLDAPVGSAAEFGFLWSSFCSKLRLNKLVDPESRHFNKAYVEPAHAPTTKYEDFSGLVLFQDGAPIRVGGYISEEAIERLKKLDELQGITLDRQFDTFTPADLLPLSKSRITKFNEAWLGPIRQALKGEAYAESGRREVTLAAMSWALAKRFPTVDPRELAEPFRQGIEYTAGLSDGDASGVTFDDFVMKLDGAQVKFLQENQIKKAQVAADHKKERERADVLVDAYEKLKLTHEKGEGFITSKELLIRDKSSGHLYYFDVRSGGYQFCFSVPVVMQLVREMAPFWQRTFGFQLYQPGAGIDEDGNAKPLTFDDEKSFELLLKEYGATCDSVEFRTYGSGYFDRERKILVRNEVRDPCALWDELGIAKVKLVGELVKKRDAELRAATESVTTDAEKAAITSQMIQKWDNADPEGAAPDFRFLREALRRSFQNGTSDLEALEMYLSRARDTRLPSKILTLLGRAASGKDALLKTTARAIGGFAAGEKCLNRFAVGIESSRVWMFSEDLPRDRFGNVLTQRLREVVTLQEHNLEMKGQQKGVKLFGYPRLMASLQDASKLNFGDGVHTRDDIEALNERFLILKLNRNSREVLHRGFWDTVEAHGLMEQYIHFAENCVPRVALHDPQSQHDRFGFLRSENSTALTDGPSLVLLEMVWKLLYQSVMQAEDVGKFCSKHPRKGSRPPVFVNKGNVYLSAKILYDQWETFAPSDKPKPRNLPTFLQTVSAVSKQDKAVRIRLGFDRVSYHAVDTQLLTAQANLLAEPEVFAARMRLNDNLDFRDGRFKLSELELSRNREFALQINPKMKSGNLALVSEES
jgi:hypothetical protein